MKLSLNKWTKTFLVFVYFGAAIIGFMLKLPSGFRGIDKELHTAFYFITAAFLNLLFTNKKLILHLLIFACLYLFGMAIEYAQAYSNKLFHVKIHGRYDPEDVKSNLKGLIAFSLLWIATVAFLFIYNKSTVKETINNEEES